MVAGRRQVALIRALSLIVLVSLALPWLAGSSDGDALTVAGVGAEPGSTAALVALGLAALLLARSGPAVAATGCALLAVTVWILNRGDRYSAPDVAWGAYVALAAEAALIAAGAIGAMRARRASAAASAGGAARGRGGRAGR